jgi:hypothetical protein
MDPLAEKYYSISPYAYCNNNPVNYIDPTGMDWYEDENGNAMWRRSQDKEYTDDNGVVWTNVGTEYLISSGKNSVLFKQRKNENGKLSLYSTTDRSEIGSHIGKKWSEEHPLIEQGLEYDNTLFDLILLGRGLFNAFFKTITTTTVDGAVQYSDDLVKAAQQAYPKLAGKTQLHHITPQYLGGAADGALVPLDAAYHQQITNAFRQAWPYGKGAITDPVLRKKIIDQVYKQFPLPPGYTY